MNFALSIIEKTRDLGWIFWRSSLLWMAEIKRTWMLRITPVGAIHRRSIGAKLYENGSFFTLSMDQKIGLVIGFTRHGDKCTGRI